jgi:uncharacterized protein (TIGR02444 family)
VTVALEIDNPFWQFSLQVYATPGVAEECLEVQDKLGVDVNVLLYAAWLGSTRGVLLEHADIRIIDDEVTAWSTDVVQPLRAVRRRLKLMPEISDQSVQMTRKRVADAELFAEQIEQALLYRMADSVGRSALGSEAAARDNVSAILAARGADAGAFPLRRLLGAAGRAGL